MISLPPGWKIEFAHRHCPRCGLDLTRQVPDAEGDQSQTDDIENHPDQMGIARVSRDLEPAINQCMQRMVAPLTKAEKERAQRNEQRWLDGQHRQQATADQQKNRKSARHQHLVPMIERQFFKWVSHARKFITGK